MENLTKPWLIAVWPGMGGVAQIAASHLAEKLKASSVRELDSAEFFEPQSIAVKDGLVVASEPPQTTFYAWRDPKGRHDLVFVIGDRQPAVAGFRYCQSLIAAAGELGVERVITFAAMATPVHPTAEPRVFGVATSSELTDELKRNGVLLLESGEINGLNGLCIAAASERGIPAMCLLGEFPFYAAAIPNPKSSIAVLDAFGGMSGVRVDVGPLKANAARIERGLVKHLEQLQQNAQLSANGEAPAEIPSEFADSIANEPEEFDAVAPEVRASIEALFNRVASDRSQAPALKRELDRHGLFAQYEDRFLDLFKRS